MNKLEGRVEKVGEKLQFHGQSSYVITSKTVLKLLEAQNSTSNDNKKGEKDESLSKPEGYQSKDVQAPTAGPLNPNSEVAIKPVKTKRKSTHTERHEERKKTEANS